MTRGVLLVNLGTPASCTTSDVRAYLGEFLNDPYVIDLPSPFRQLLVGGIILPFRPRRSAEAYDKIWNAAGPGTGSPLLHYSRRLEARLTDALGDMPVALAMRYGQPDIPSALDGLRDAGVGEVLMIALYAQHADSTRTTTIEAVRHALPEGMSLTIVPPFFDDPHYLAVQAAIIGRHLPARWDHLLLSYHGLPERHLIKADPTGNHCLQAPDCCEVPSTAHPTCYRHQVRMTSRRLASLLGIGEDRYTVAYQSRLGRLPWLSPYTDQVLGELPSRGVQHLAVACPAFVADNLETLEEIGMAGKARFLEAGGSTFTLVPCLNDDPDWVSVIARWCREDTPASAATVLQTSSARSETAT